MGYSSRWKKILETIQKELDLSKDDLQVSFDVLRDYGNMSSPTILFVLKNIMRELRDQKEKSICCGIWSGTYYGNTYTRKMNRYTFRSNETELIDAPGIPFKDWGGLFTRT